MAARWARLRRGHARCGPAQPLLHLLDDLDQLELLVADPFKELACRAVLDERRRRCRRRILAVTATAATATAATAAAAHALARAVLASLSEGGALIALIALIVLIVLLLLRRPRAAGARVGLDALKEHPLLVARVDLT